MKSLSLLMQANSESYLKPVQRVNSPQLQGIKVYRILRRISSCVIKFHALTSFRLAISAADCLTELRTACKESSPNRSC